MIPYNVRTNCNRTPREYGAAGSGISGILRKTGGIGAVSVPSISTGSKGSGQLSYAAAGNSMDTDVQTRQPAMDLLVFGYACKIFRDDQKARELDQGKHLIPWMGDVNLKIDRYDVRGALCDLAPYEAPPGGYGNRLEYLSTEEQRAEQLCEEERYLYLYNNEEEHKLQQEEDLKRLQQETSGGNYSQVGFQYDGQTVTMDTTNPADSISPIPEELEQTFMLPHNLLVAPPPGMQVPDTMKQHAIIEKTARFIATQGTQMEILIKAKQASNSQFDFLTQGGVLQPYYRHLLDAIKQGKFAAAPEPAAAETPTDGDAIPPTSPKRLHVITVPTIKYKPSANCAYTQLISKIKGVPLQTVLDDEGSASNSQHSGGTASPTPSCKSTQSGEFMPVLLQYNGSTFEHAPSVEADEENANDEVPKVELLKNTSALALAQGYSSESEPEEQEEVKPENKFQKITQPQVQLKPPPLLHFPLPEETLRHIIDKTATYVIKNGRQFEETLRTKSVERFNFLLPDNEYYPYYLYKITGDADAASKEEKTRKAAAVAAALISRKGLNSSSATATVEKTPVSFSIRARDEHTPLQPTLPQEASDDEEEATAAGVATAASGNESARSSMPDSVQRAIKQVETQLLARKPSTGSSATTAQQKDQRQAEERFKDKLAQIARDKLNGLITREKQLQQERKRKAMLFLTQIKGETASSASEDSSINAQSSATAKLQATAEKAEQNAIDDSDGDSKDSVRSIPITYFGPDDDDDDDEDEPKPVTASACVQGASQKPVGSDNEEEESGDLEKYNLLNDDSTNTYTSKAPPAAPTLPAPSTDATDAPATAVLLSDDDDVMVISAPSAPVTRANIRMKRGKRSSRHRSSSSSSSSDGASSTTSSSDSSSPKRSRTRTRSRSRDKSNTHSYHRRHKSKMNEDTETIVSQSRHRRRDVISPSYRHHHKQPRRKRSRSHSTVASSEDERHQRSHHHHKRRHESKKSHKHHKRRRRTSNDSQ